MNISNALIYYDKSTIEESMGEMNNSVLSGWILDGVQSIIHGTTHGRMRTKEPSGNEHHPSAK